MAALTGALWKAVPDPELFHRMEHGVGHDEEAIASSSMLRYITADGDELNVPLHEADPSQIDGGQMVRTIPKYKGRKNYSGWAWTATGPRSVPYESLLERARILVADFDDAVSGITSQAIELTGVVGTAKVQRFPDLFLLRRDAPPLVVDVTSASKLYEKERIDAFTWTAAAVRGTGWEYEVWCGATETAMTNLMYLNGYKRRSVINEAVLTDLLANRQSGELVEIEDLLARNHHRFDVAPAIRHALWTGIYQADLSRPLDRTTHLTFVGSQQ